MFFVWVRTVFSDSDELTGDVGTTQVGSEQPKHVELTLAEWVDQTLSLSGFVASVPLSAFWSRRT